MSGKEVIYMKSIKKKNKIGSDSNHVAEDDDVWDDSVLVQAYNKAVDHAEANVLQNLPYIPPKSKLSAHKTDQIKQWKVGDYCRCEYSEDRNYYEASIIDIFRNLGMCIVKYIGYDNEEKVHLSKLKPSKGETARAMQMRQALQENDAADGPSDDRQSELGYVPQLGRKRSVSKQPENTNFEETASSNEIDNGDPTSSRMFNPLITGSIPPPPPPQLFAKLDDSVPESDAMNAMLMSWYMSGYHTGYYLGLKAAKK